MTDVITMDLLSDASLNDLSAFVYHHAMPGPRRDRLCAVVVALREGFEKAEALYVEACGERDALAMHPASLQDRGNARIGERMRKYFPIDDDAPDASPAHTPAPSLTDAAIEVVGSYVSGADIEGDRFRAAIDNLALAYTAAMRRPLSPQTPPHTEGE